MYVARDLWRIYASFSFPNCPCTSIVRVKLLRKIRKYNSLKDSRGPPLAFGPYDRSPLILNLIFPRRDYGPRTGYLRSFKQHTMEFSPLYHRIKRCTPTALAQQCLLP